MRLRIAVPVALAGMATFLLSAAQAPPPMFSPWYEETLRDILHLEEADVAVLERRVAANAEDFPTRLKLMAYHQRADRSARPEDRLKRLQHVSWLVEHHPESELLHSYVSQFRREELTEGEYARLIALWDTASKTQTRDAAVQWNAAFFFQTLDSERYVRSLEAAAADPNHPFALRPLAHQYALAIVNGGKQAARAMAALDASSNVWVLGNAAHMLQNYYNQTLQRGSPQPRLAKMAERYFLRAKALDPHLDRNAILPQIDLQAIARAQQVDQQKWQKLFEEAASSIQRLGIEAFPELPPAVAGVLRVRGCRVPQPSGEGAGRNVVRGEFFRKGESGWAVLCSVNGSSALLAFRNDRDPNPDTVSASEDRGYLQGLGGDTVGYSHVIRALGRDFIMGHYRAYGGTEPPPIEHHGIDDAFDGKASTTWYFHGGKWLALTGAD